jgi:hypothetical protein
MPTTEFSLTDEAVERIANRVAEKLADLRSKQARPSVDDRLQISRAEAARRLGYDPSTLDRLVRRGLIHPNRGTRHPKYPVKELERFIKECSV